MIEIAAQVADLVIAECKRDGCVEVSLANGSHLLLEFDHGSLDEECQDAEGDSADDCGPGSSKQKKCITVSIAKGDGRNGKEDQPGEEDAHYGQNCLDLPIDAYLVHGSPLKR